LVVRYLENLSLVACKVKLLGWVAGKVKCPTLEVEYLEKLSLAAGRVKFVLAW
jgi:hypothetical protein